MNFKAIRKYFLLIIGISLIMLFIAKFIISKVNDSDFQLVTIDTSSFDIKVNTVGVIDAERSQMVSSMIKGDRGKIIYIIDDGKRVNKGDVLIRFDQTLFEADVLRLTGEIRSREVVVDSAEQVLELVKSQVEGEINTAEFNLKIAEQEHARHISYIKDLEDLMKKGYSYPTEISQAKKKAEELQLKAEKAKTELGQIKKEGIFKVAKEMYALQKAKRELETVKLSLEEAKSELSKTVIHAPSSGIAINYETFRDNQKRKPRVGDTVWQNQPLLYLPDISSIIVKTQVREVDLHRIKINQEAVVQVDAYPDIIFQGKVTSIGVLATEKFEGSKGEKYFQLVVSLTGEDTRLRPGMTARMSILTDNVKNALSVPIQAIFNDEGRKYCYLYTGQSFKKVEVFLGRQNEDMAEIISGLKKGDKVSLVKPTQDGKR